MTESSQDNSNTPKKKPKSKIKATTGAWWKSTVVTGDTEPGAERSSTEPDPSETRTLPEKPVEPAPATEQVDDGRASDSPPAAAPTKKGRSSRGRRKQKARSERDQSATAKPVDEGAQPDRSASLPEAAVEPAESPETSSADAATVDQPTENPPKEEQKSRRSRGRRGGRKKSKQKQAEAQSPKPPEADEDDLLDDDLVADDDSDDILSDEPAVKGSGGKDGSQAHQPVVKLLINAEEPEECRLALLEDGRLESLHVTTVSRVQTRNNIYKARVVAIEPNLQAAFVDYGMDKNGFLPFNEIHPEYYRHDLSAEVQSYVNNQQWKKLSISDVLVKGQEMLVQVVKEEVGKKGANLTTYLSLPGRCVVLMPGSESEGVSRKISGEERRNQLREIMNSMQIPEGIGWIVRTASVDITKTALSRDVRYLLRLWREIKAKGQHLDGVGLLYQDHNCVMRFLREHFDPSTQEILVDDETALEKVKEFTEMLPAKQRTVKVKLHQGNRPIFNHHSVEDQIESIYQPRVSLPSGGSIVIEPTEALVSIDVNSGSTAKGQNFEETIFQANMEAATELARQLRLRDLGGLIVVDFIDMRSSRNIREVERQVKTAMKRDKAKVDISRISRFGLMQISRQKLGSPIETGTYRVCDHCRGRGTVRSVETLALFYLRRIHTGASRKQVVRISCRFPIDVAQYLLNNKRQELVDLEERYLTKVVVTADPTLRPVEHEILFQKAEKEEPSKKQA